MSQVLRNLKIFKYLKKILQLQNIFCEFYKLGTFSNFTLNANKFTKI